MKLTKPLNKYSKCALSYHRSNLISTNIVNCHIVSLSANLRIDVSFLLIVY